MPGDAPPETPEHDSIQASFSAARLKQAVRGGTGIATTAHVAGQIIGFMVLAALYRLLSPEDYGLLAMVLPLLALANLFTAPGFNIATVQHDALLPGHVSTLFWLNLGLSGAIAITLVAISPAVAWFYGRHEVLWLVVTLAGTVVISALGSQHQALLERQLRLAPLAVARLAAHVGAGLAAIFAAWVGWGVWALVLQLYVSAALLTLFLWRVERWRPVRPRRGEGVRELVRFGGFFTASSVMFYLTQYLDKIIVGYALGAAALGLYSQAFNIMLKPVYLLTTPLAGVMLPGLSRAMGDPQAYRNLLAAFSRLLAITMLPAGAGLLIVAPEVMLVLGGETWAEAGIVLRALAAAILVQGFTNTAGSIFTSAGRADRLFVAGTAMAVSLLAGFLIGLAVGYSLGTPLIGLAWGYSLTMLALAIPYMTFALRTVGMPLVDWLSEVRRPALATVGMAVGVCAVRWLLIRAVAPGPAMLLAIETTAGVVTYAALGRSEARWFADQLRQLRGRRAAE